MHRTSNPLHFISTSERKASYPWTLDTKWTKSFMLPYIVGIWIPPTGETPMQVISYARPYPLPPLTNLPTHPQKLWRPFLKMKNTPLPLPLVHRPTAITHRLWKTASPFQKTKVHIVTFLCYLFSPHEIAPLWPLTHTGAVGSSKGRKCGSFRDVSIFLLHPLGSIYWSVHRILSIGP